MNDKSDILEGRIRAIEAVLAEISEVTIEVIDAAKERLREKARGGPGSLRALGAELNERVGKPLDEYGETALDSLRHAIQDRKGPSR
jgi:hypothetical protein